MCGTFVKIEISKDLQDSGTKRRIEITVENL